MTDDKSPPSKTSSAAAVPAPFDRAAVRLHRDRAAGRAAPVDFLFDETATRLVERLDDINRRFPRVLDLGCRGGGLSRLIAGRPGVERVIACDLSPAMAARARLALSPEIPVLAVDEEWLPFAPESFDLIVSNLALHWVNDLPGCLVQLRRALKPDGLLLAAMLGSGTLEALRGAWMAAELACEGGASPRISPFAEVRVGGDLLSRAGFALPVADLDDIHVSFASPLELMGDLAAMGEAGAAHERRKSFTRRATLMEVATRYPRDADGRVSARFAVVWLTAWAPGPGQPQPLKPGSATARLADHLGVAEQKAGAMPPRRKG